MAVWSIPVLSLSYAGTTEEWECANDPWHQVGQGCVCVCVCVCASNDANFSSVTLVFHPYICIMGTPTTLPNYIQGLVKFQALFVIIF